MITDPLGQKIHEIKDEEVWGPWPRKTPAIMASAPALHAISPTNGHNRVDGTMCACHAFGTRIAYRRRKPGKRRKLVEA